MALNVVKCTSCGRLTPTKHGECIYCQTSLTARRHPAAAPPGQGQPPHEEPRVLGGRSKRFTRRSDERTHWLVVGSREPIKLDPGKLFVIGRDTRASLVVHAPDVSRQHAEIEWDEHDPPRPLLGEVRSSNGTFLNGRPVTRDAPQPLRSGDEVRLGETFTFTYLHVADRDLKHELEERGRVETRRFRKEDLVAPEGFPSATQAFGTGSGLLARDALEQLVAVMSPGSELAPLPLEGSLTTLSGAELLQRLHRQGSSGVLTIWSGSHSGELALQEGRCLRARFASLTGRAALEHVAGLAQGLYRFAPDGTLGSDDLSATAMIPVIRPTPPPGGPALRTPSRPASEPAHRPHVTAPLPREAPPAVSARLGRTPPPPAAPPAPPPAPRAGGPRPNTPAPLKRVMPLRKEQAPEGRRSPLRPPSGLGAVEDESGHGSAPLRRAAPPQPLRPPPAARPGVPRRRPPPLPHRPDQP